MKLLYFRDTRTISIKSTKGEDIEINLNSLTLLERLFISAYLTKIDTNSKKTLAQIIFAYSSFEVFTRKNFVDYDKVVTDTLEKHVELLHWIKENHHVFKKKNGELGFSTYAIFIDTEDIFAERNGRTGMSFSPIAWKAFVLAAAKSKYKTNMNLRKACIYNWIDASVNVEDMDEDKLTAYKRNTSQTKNTISKWLDKVKIEGEFVKAYYVVGGRDNSIEEE